MANDNGSSAVRTSLPLAVFWLAACTVPDTEGADTAAADVAEVGPMVAEPANGQRRLGASPWLEPERSGRWPHDSARASDIRTMIVKEAARQGNVPPALALAVAKVGSNVASRALGAAETVGTMQIRPALADEFDMDVDDLHEAASNIRAGIACLAALQERYAGDWRLALSHYRGGPLAEADGMFVPHSFTRRYVRDVLRWWRLYRHDPLTAAWLRKVQGLPRFAAGPPGAKRGTATVAATSRGPAHPDVGGRWRVVSGGRRFQ